MHPSSPTFDQYYFFGEVSLAQPIPFSAQACTQARRCSPKVRSVAGLRQAGPETLAAEDTSDTDRLNRFCGACAERAEIRKDAEIIRPTCTRKHIIPQILLHWVGAKLSVAFFEQGLKEHPRAGRVREQ